MAVRRFGASGIALDEAALLQQRAAEPAGVSHQVARRIRLDWFRSP